MKLSGAEAARFISRPDLSMSGLLIYGKDQAEVATRRALAIQAIKSQDGDSDDLRVSRLLGVDVRRDPALAMDAMRAQGFFSGRPIVLVEEAADSVAGACEAALSEATPEDGFLIATAGALPAKSKLRSVFEKARNAVAAPVYDDPPNAAEIEQWLITEGAANISGEVARDVAALSGRVERSALRDLCRKIALFSLEEGAPVTAADVAALAPLGEEASTDEAVAAVFEGRPEMTGPLISRLSAQGQTPVSIVLAAQRHARRLHAVLSRGGSPESAVSALRPPAFGPQKQALLRQCRRWSIPRLEQVLKLLIETDAQLRGASSATGQSLVERMALRIAMTSDKK